MKWRRLAWSVYKERLALSSLPILTGPFRSEVGFEAMYWIPFLSHMRDEASPEAKFAERIIPITRGGSAAWYATTHPGVELYTLRTPQEVRVQNALDWQVGKSEKQMRVTAFDRAVIADAAKALGLKQYLTLHPAWMYQTLSPYWAGMRGLQWVAPKLEWSMIPPPPLPDGLQLPERFACVKFYQRPTFQGHQLAKQAVIATIERLAHQVPVIVLDSDAIVPDRHPEFALPKIPNTAYLSDLIQVTPQNNLAVQSAVLGRAVLFAGPYGGFAQLAMRMGRPTLCYYDNWNFTCIAHKHLADGIATQMGLPFHVYRLSDIPWVLGTLPPATMAIEAPPLDMRQVPTLIEHQVA